VDEMRGALGRTMRALDPYIQPLVVKARLEDGNGRRR
jgi:3-deoxy-D-manno-octulosonic-acid transferase